jgi:hypothetical protein
MRRHVSYGPRSYLLAGVGFGAVTCPQSVWAVGLKSKGNCGRPRCAFKAHTFPRRTRAWVPMAQACPSAVVPAKGVCACQALQ